MHAFASIPHLAASLPIVFRHPVDFFGTVKLEEVKELNVKICDNPHNPTGGINLNFPLRHASAPLSVIMKDDESYNIPILHPVPPRHPWRSIIPTECLRNSWTLAIDDDEPMTAQGAQETLAFLSSKG